MEGYDNKLNLTGTLAGRPVFSHTGGGEDYLTFPLEIKRLSGKEDRINIIAPRYLMELTPVTDGEKVSISGELRSFNNRSGVGSKLVITVLAREITITDSSDENHVELTGTICKTPTLRRTPMGRQICDIMLAVSRRYGRSDYLPVIAWGRTAQMASLMDTGDRISLTGRIQSRTYIKTVDGEATERTAFEVSAVTLEEAEE